MNFRRKAFWWGLGIAMVGTLSAFQLPFREFPGVEYRVGDITLPQDWQERTEWVFARLMYPPASGGRFGRGYGFRGNGIWSEGNTIWTQDYPRADRHFVLALRRLTRISVRSVEQPVNLDEGAVYDWPWLYAVQAGRWQLTDSQARSMREYLLRGGFFMADDLHGTFEWQMFFERIKQVFPDRPIVEIPNNDPIFHTVYDLDDRYQIPGAEHLDRGYKADGKGAHWRGIYDDKGRIMIAISVNSDVGDSWEWADSPEYPEKFSALGIRIGVNYIIYAMTH